MIYGLSAIGAVNTDVIEIIVPRWTRAVAEGDIDGFRAHGPVVAGIEGDLHVMPQIVLIANRSAGDLMIAVAKDGCIDCHSRVGVPFVPERENVLGIDGDAVAALVIVAEGGIFVVAAGDVQDVIAKAAAWIGNDCQTRKITGPAVEIAGFEAGVGEDAGRGSGVHGDGHRRVALELAIVGHQRELIGARVVETRGGAQDIRVAKVNARAAPGDVVRPEKAIIADSPHDIGGRRQGNGLVSASADGGGPVGVLRIDRHLDDVSIEG